MKPLPRILAINVRIACIDKLKNELKNTLILDNGLKISKHEDVTQTSEVEV